MRGDIFHAQLHQVVQRHAKTNGLNDSRCSRLKLHRRIVIGDRVFGHFTDHIAAAHEGAHFGQSFLAHPDRARARRAIQLMPGDRIEIAAQGLHINGRVHRALRAIDQHRHALFPRRLADRLHIDLGAQHVGQMRNRHQLGFRPDRVNYLLRIKRPGHIAIDPFQHHALTFTQEVPRHDIGVMLHHAEDDLIARLHPRHGPAIGHHIDAFGGAGIEDNLILIGGIQELGDDAPDAFVLFSCKIRKVVQATVNVGIFFGIGTRDRINHHLGLLRRCAVVQIDQRFAVHLTRQDGKIAADFGHIIHVLALPSY